MVHVRRQIYCTSPMDCLGIYHTWLRLEQWSKPFLLSIFGWCKWREQERFSCSSDEQWPLGALLVIGCIGGVNWPQVTKTSQTLKHCHPFSPSVFQKNLPSETSSSPLKIRGPPAGYFLGQTWHGGGVDRTLQFPWWKKAKPTRGSVFPMLFGAFTALPPASCCPGKRTSRQSPVFLLAALATMVL